MIDFSILDRLIQVRGEVVAIDDQSRVDRARSLRRNAPVATRAEFERYRDSVRENLEWILNTRQLADPIPEGLNEVEQSVYNYGLPDISQLNLNPTKNQLDQEALASIISRVIQTFEKRIGGVKVIVPSNWESGGDLRFNISGRLRMDPRPEPVAYDTTLELTRGQFEVEVSADA